MDCGKTFVNGIESYILQLTGQTEKNVERKRVNLYYNEQLNDNLMMNMFDSMLLPFLSKCDGRDTLYISIMSPLTWEPIVMPPLMVSDYKKDTFWKYLESKLPLDFGNNVEGEYHLAIIVENSFI